MLIRKSFVMLAASTVLAATSYGSGYGSSYGAKKTYEKKKKEHHATHESKEKCYGVAKKGWNDCKTAYHDCKHRSKKDYDPTDWKYVEHGTCKDWHSKVAKKKKHSSAY